MASSRSSPRKRGLKERLAGLADNIGQFAEVVGNVVSSAGELLIDTDLRRKGANYIVNETTRNVNEIRGGIEERAENLQQGARARLGAGAQRVTGLLRSIERQIQEFQRQQQQRDLQAELEHHHKLPVDIQIGDQVLEDMPQEMRSRLWYVLLESPDLAQTLMKRHKAAARSGSPRSAGASTNASAHMAASGVADGPAGASQFQAVADNGAAAAEAHQHSVPSSPRTESPFAAFSGTPGSGGASATAAETADPVHYTGSAVSSPAAGAGAVTAQDLLQQPVEELAAGAGAVPAESSRCTNDIGIPDIEDLLARQSTSVDAAQEPSAAVGTSHGANAELASGDETGLPAAAAAVGGVDAAGHAAEQGSNPPAAASPWAHRTVAAVGSSHSRSSSPAPAAPNPWGPQALHVAAATAGVPQDGSQTAPGHALVPSATAADIGRSCDPETPATGAALPAPPATAPADHARSAGDEWEMVPADVPAAAVGAGRLEAIDSIKALVQQLPGDDSADATQSAQQAVLQAMLEVPWIPGEGVPQEIDEHGEYAQLLAAGCGHVEDVISRDVARTFPEHPLFSAQLQGQQRLLRLLKAYAAADPEVGYCQGMAFAAGVLLMYLPEEPAYRLYHRIMTSGPNLRRYYLPGLEPLKMELSRFELLLATHYPQLHQHLLDAGLPALLYAAQWFMTTFSCPFPLHVAARVLDILLQSDSDAILSQLGLALMGALQDNLLQMDDFESLITYLKVQPLSWPVHTHRQVINEALSSPATEAELTAAAAAAAAEAARLGRFSSFSNRQLARLDTRGTQHELVPGVVGPRTAAEAGGEAGGQASAAQAGGEQHLQQVPESSQAEGVQSSIGQQLASNAAVSSSSLALQPRGGSGAERLEELDSAFLDLDLDMIMPAVVLDVELEQGRGA
eukprot:GHUV01005030.1.p1 GENE.GHUV01005030.1~~GHUV01005030.1.p1  ORF type:complete len:910 (+),score=344.00 GHUV01005030.1:211-2940(+)